MPGLFADVEAGSGAVALTDEFLEAAPRLRLEVLQQWVKALNVQKERALVDMFREYAASLRGLTIVEQIERFRVACHRRGVDCPPEFPVLLQRF
ncbi:MAG: hypothetical protein ABIS28_07720 [Caldimonas sp.]